MRVAARTRSAALASFCILLHASLPLASARKGNEASVPAEGSALGGPGGSREGDAESGTLQPVGDRWAWNRRTYRHFVGMLALGRRLPSVGADGSRTYADIFAGMTWGTPNGLQHGFGLDTSLGRAEHLGIAAAPSYLLLWRSDAALMGLARVGVPVAVGEWTYGFELALGGAGLGTKAFGLSVEAVATLYQQTPQQEGEFLSALCLEVGIWFDEERLP